MIPLVATGIVTIATITVAAMLGFMEDGMELAMTSKEVSTIQNLKGSENLHILIKNNDLVINNEGIIPSHVMAIKTIVGNNTERTQTYDKIIDPDSSIVVAGNYSGKIVHVITSLGNVFIEKDDSVPIQVKSTGNHMSIVQTTMDGSIVFGRGEQPGIERIIRPYSIVDQNDNYAFVLNDDTTETILIPTFDGSYYHTNRLIKKYNTPNILEYSDKNQTGNLHTGRDANRLAFYGVGRAVMEVDSQLANQTIRLSSTMQKGSMLEIVGKTSNSSSAESTVLRISSTPEHISVHSDHVINLTNAFDGDVNTYAVVKSNHKEIILDFNILAQRVIKSLNIDGDRSVRHYAVLCIYVDVNGNEFQKLAQHHMYYHRNSEIDLNYEGSFRYIKIVNCNGASYVPQVNIHKIDTAFVINKPDISMGKSQYGSYYETTFTMPYSAKLIVTSNSVHPTTIRGEVPRYELPRFEIEGLVAETPYRIEREGFTSIVSKTASDGSISLSASDIGVGTKEFVGGALRLHPNSVGHIGEFGTLVIDIINDDIIQLPVSGNNKLIYVPHAYIRMVLPTTSTLENVSVDTIPIPYLDKSYNAGSGVMIPILPNTKKLHAVIDGINTTVQIAHIDVATQIIPIHENTEFVSRYGSNDSTVSAVVEASTTAFMTAAHAGKMYAIVDMNGITGNAAFTMNSDYTGELVEAHGTYTRIFPVRSTISVPYKYYFPPPDSINNLNDLATDHANQLVAALNRGQVSTLITEIDVYRNFEHLKTERVYKANVGTADIVLDSINATHSTIPFSPNSYINGFSKFNTIHKVQIEYIPTSTNHLLEIDVNAGDMIEFVIRVGFNVHATPAPEIDQYVSNVHATSSTSAYIHASTGFDGGSIIIGMS